MYSSQRLTLRVGNNKHDVAKEYYYTQAEHWKSNNQERIIIIIIMNIIMIIISEDKPSIRESVSSHGTA